MKKTSTSPDRLFADRGGSQVYELGPEALQRGVVTVPYDAPVRTLMSEIQDKSLIVNPLFQRRDVWDRTRKSRLIESLLLNIPVPVLYFAEDTDGTRVVVDGQQRLRSIDEFVSGSLRLAGLQVLSTLNGKRWTDLSPQHARVFQGRTLRCVVITSASDPVLRFEMFERLNTGGVALTDQELRNCVYRGKLNALLEQIVTSSEWLGFIDKDEPDPRMRHHELVLRFFALRDVVSDYKPPLKGVLSNYMDMHRDSEGIELERLSQSFMAGLSAAIALFGENAFRRIVARDGDREQWDRQINRAVFDVQMLALHDLDPSQISRSVDQVRAAFADLCLHDDEFRKAITLATADRKSFYLRLRKWGDVLGAVGLRPSYMDVLPAK